MFDMERLSAAIESGTMALPLGLSHEERQAFVRARLLELGIEVPPLPRKHDPEACLAIVRTYIEQMKLEPNDA